MTSAPSSAERFFCHNGGKLTCCGRVFGVTLSIPNQVIQGSNWKRSRNAGRKRDLKTEPRAPTRVFALDGTYRASAFRQCGGSDPRGGKRGDHGSPIRLRRGARR